MAGLGRGRHRQWGQRTLTGILRKPLSDNKRTLSSWTGTHNSNTGTPGKEEAEPSALGAQEGWSGVRGQPLVYEAHVCVCEDRVTGVQPTPAPTSPPTSASTTSHKKERRQRTCKRINAITSRKKAMPSAYVQMCKCHNLKVQRRPRTSRHVSAITSRKRATSSAYVQT